MKRLVVRCSRWVAMAWLVALLMSWTTRLFLAANDTPHPAAPVAGSDSTAALVHPWVDGARAAGRDWLACERIGPAGGSDRDATPILLLHGNPGRGGHMRQLARRLADERLVIVPDLPGFGASMADPPDLSFPAMSDMLLQLLDRLGIERAHWLGFSQSGGVVLHAWEQQPARVASVTLLSAIGVQELELLGDHSLNHAVHELQRWAFVGLDLLVPHFGHPLFQRGINYARWFSDSDQRPLRGLLQRIDVPLLVIHGEDDPLVPVAAAREHHRLVPHAEAWIEPGSHFLVFADPPPFATALAGFLRRADAGLATTRDGAGPTRLAAAEQPFDDSRVPPASGVALLLLMVVIAASSLVSEDLACVGAGLLASRGQIGYVAAVGASFTGIFLGDVALFLAGRWLGRPAVRRAPLRWVVSESAVDRATVWFARRGPAAIFISRFTPGLRLPTYVAAGVAGTSLLWFCAWFALAGLTWTPLLVGLSQVLGGELMSALTWVGEHTWLGVVVVLAVLLTVVKLLVPALTHRGRRQLRGRWLRLVRWEYWPPWLFYPPIVAWIGWLSLRHGGLSTVTAVNPAMPAGGVIGESKADILDALAGAGEALPAWTRVPADDDLERRVARVQAWRAEHGLGWPVVLKPDVGQRGSGVHVVRDAEQLRAALAAADELLVAQEHVGGAEFGVFWAREPGAERGHVFSVTEKHLPTVTGDGRRSMEQLVLDDPRACAQAGVIVSGLGARALDVPAAGDEVALTDLGTHCRGALFLDGARWITPELTAAVDAIARTWDGFHFGRFDLRAPSAEDLAAGRGLRILELNGMTSEATHVYDPRHGVLYAWRVLCRQWGLAFRIAAANRAAGAPITHWTRVLREALAYRARAAGR